MSIIQMVSHTVENTVSQVSTNLPLCACMAGTFLPCRPLVSNGSTVSDPPPEDSKNKSNLIKLYKEFIHLTRMT